MKRITVNSRRFQILLLLVGLLLAGCSKKTTTTDPSTSPSGSPGNVSWTQIGPNGGFFPAVAFDPGQSNVVWASSDDAGGIYKSTDSGATWSMVQTGSKNQGSYFIRFDPTNPQKIFAPNHFGRGMLRSTDGGSTWIAAQAGLPLNGTQSQRIYDLAIHPSTPNILFAATGMGLYKSTDGGANFSVASTTLPGGTGVRSVAFRSDGVLFIGKSDGVLGLTTDNGSSWTKLLDPSGIGIEALQFSATSLYAAYQSGILYKLDKMTFSGGVINDPSQPNAAKSANRVALAVKSGASAATDVIVLGTSGASSIPSSKFGIFISTNGGTSWYHPTSGLNDSYIMSVAIDPTNSNHIIAGSLSGYGLFRTTNGGSSWTTISKNLIGTASLGLAQSPSNPSQLLASNTACGGFSANYESTDKGASWTLFRDFIPDDGIMAFDFAPSGNGALLAGTCTQGIYRSPSGTAGPWTQVIATAGKRIDRFIHDQVVTANLYAVVPDGDSSHSLYYSSNEGTSFTARTGIQAYNIATHPTRAGEGIVANWSDAYGSNDAFATSYSLGASSAASSEGLLTAVAFNPDRPTEVLLGGAKGGIYKSTNYVYSGSGVTWKKLSTPIVAAPVRDLVIVNRGGRTVYYAATAGGDTGFLANWTVGVFRSLDGGENWTNISDGMFPSTLTWRMIPDRASPTTSFLLGMWAGGLLRLADTE